jgi:regulator of sigma E protease
MIQLIHSNPGQSVDLVVRRNGKTLTKTGVPRWSVRFAGASWSFQTGDRAVVNEDHSGSELKKTGLQHGDVLLAFGGTSIRGGRQFVEAIEANDGKPARLEILRNGKKLTLTLRPAIRWVKYPDGLRWVFPGSYMDIDSPAEAATARKLGFEYGDVLISISGKKIKSGEAMVKTLEKGADQPAKLIFQRGEKRHTIVAKGELGPPEIGYHDAIGLLGFTPAPRLVKTSLGESIKRGLQAPLGILMAFVQVFSSKRGLSEGVGGPILIAKMTASSVALGPYYYIGLIGSLSMSLAFINLMPIPVLDGGHLLVLAIERIRRKRLTPQQMATFQMIGLTIIISLIITIFYSDILKIVEGKVPQ